MFEGTAEIKASVAKSDPKLNWPTTSRIPRGPRVGVSVVSDRSTQEYVL